MNILDTDKRNHGKIYNVLIVITLSIWMVFDNISMPLLGGAFKLSYAASIIWCAVFLPKVIKIIMQNTVSKIVVVFLAVMLAANVLNLSFGGVKAVISLSLNTLPFFVAFLWVFEEMVEFKTLQHFILALLGINILFALFQEIIFVVFGSAIVPFWAGGESWLVKFQIPGFQVEPNVLGKLLAWSILFLITRLVANIGFRIEKVLFCIASFLFGISLTRTALFALVVALGIGVVFYINTENAKRYFMLLAVFVIFMIVGCVFTLFTVQLIGSSLNKWLNLLDLTGGSGSFRMKSLIAAFEAWSETWKTRLLGCGLGQTLFEPWENHPLVKAGGNDMMSILLGGGHFTDCIFVHLGCFVPPKCHDFFSKD